MKRWLAGLTVAVALGSLGAVRAEDNGGGNENDGVRIQRRPKRNAPGQGQGDNRPPRDEPPQPDGPEGDDGHRPPPPSREDVFKHLDANGDGTISKTEFMNASWPPPPPDHRGPPPDDNGDQERPMPPPPPGDVFKKMDTDGNGMVSKDEFLKARHPEPPPGMPAPDFADMFKRIDTNGDGNISKEEFQKAPRPGPPNPDEMFKRADTDGDGKVSKEEFAKLPAPPRRGPPPPPPDGQGNGDQPPPPPAPPTAEEAFKRLDTDGDGFLSKDEMAKGMRRPPGGPGGPGGRGGHGPRPDGDAPKGPPPEEKAQEF